MLECLTCPFSLAVKKSWADARCLVAAEMGLGFEAEGDEVRWAGWGGVGRKGIGPWSREILEREIVG